MKANKRIRDPRRIRKGPRHVSVRSGVVRFVTTQPHKSNMVRLVGAEE